MQVPSNHQSAIATSAKFFLGFSLILGVASMVHVVWGLLGPSDPSGLHGYSLSQLLRLACMLVAPTVGIVFAALAMRERRLRAWAAVGLVLNLLFHLFTVVAATIAYVTLARMFSGR